jgi:hypothetical protein
MRTHRWWCALIFSAFVTVFDAQLVHPIVTVIAAVVGFLLWGTILWRVMDRLGDL